MSKKFGNLKNPDLIKDLVMQNKYSGVTAWNEAGITGEGVVVWNMEGDTSHGVMTHDRILDAAPNATVLNANQVVEANGKEIKVFKCHHYERPDIQDSEYEEYEIEDFIKKFNVKIISRSFGGELAKYNRNSPLDKKWIELKEKYNLIFFDAADNEGDEEKRGKNSLPILVQAVTLNGKGKPQRENYSSTVVDGTVFTAFVGWANGTSFSCPYMAGMCALLVERYGNHITQEQAIEYFKHYAEDLGEEGFDKYNGLGLALMGNIEDEWFGKDEEEMKFKDVKDDAWYAKFVDYVSDKGYMSGYPDGTFKPSNTLTRAEMAAILYNLENSEN